MDQLILSAALWPQRQPWSVGGAGFGEVGPVAHHLFAQLAILGAYGCSGARVQRAEDVLNVVGVEGKRARMKLAGQRGQFKVVAIDGCFSRFFVGW